MLLLSSADFFSKISLFQNSFRNVIRVSNGFDPDQDRHSVGPDLVPNCLQGLSADDESGRQQEKEEKHLEFSRSGLDLKSKLKGYPFVFNRIILFGMVHCIYQGVTGWYL